MSINISLSNSCFLTADLLSLLAVKPTPSVVMERLVRFHWSHSNVAHLSRIWMWIPRGEEKSKPFSGLACFFLCNLPRAFSPTYKIPTTVYTLACSTLWMFTCRHTAPFHKRIASILHAPTIYLLVHIGCPIHLLVCRIMFSKVPIYRK